MTLAGRRVAMSFNFMTGTLAVWVDFRELDWPALDRTSGSLAVRTVGRSGADCKNDWGAALLGLRIVSP